MITIRPRTVPPAVGELLNTRLLLVEPRPAARALLQRAMTSVALVVPQTDFPTARQRLESEGFDFLVTNVRLGLFNGLHLVYLAAAEGIRTLSIVYTEQAEVGLAQEVHRAGAFYETWERLLVTISGYARGNLPPRDRRKRLLEDRRTMVRGGRRQWDHHIAAYASTDVSRV